MTQDNATIIRCFVDEVITQGKIDSAAQYVWEDVVEQVPLPGQGPGLDGLKDILRAMRRGFPDIMFSLTYAQRLSRIARLIENPTWGPRKSWCKTEEPRSGNFAS